MGDGENKNPHPGNEKKKDIHKFKKENLCILFELSQFRLLQINLSYKKTF